MLLIRNFYSLVLECLCVCDFAVREVMHVSTPRDTLAGWSSVGRWAGVKKGKLDSDVWRMMGDCGGVWGLFDIMVWVVRV